MAKVKVTKGSAIKNTKKHLKAKIIASMVSLLVILVLVLGIGGYLYGEYKNSFYPEQVVEEMGISALARTMRAGRYMELYDIAMAMADDGNGILLTPVNRRREFDYEGDILIRMSTSTGSGRIVVAQGTGNITDDIKAHAKEYASFIGKVEPVYTEKVSESGLLSGYQAAYSCGYITCGNVLSEQSFYLVALEFATNEIDRLFVVYTTQDYKELGTNLKVIEDFALLALSGSDINEVPVTDTTVQSNAGGDSEQVEAMSVEEINDYISHTYPVQTVDDAGQISGNTTGVLEQQESVELKLEE